MKKTMLTITLVLALAVPSAFANGKADQKASDLPYNGITYFDLGTESTMPETTTAWEPGDMPFNGITYFDLGKLETATRNYSVSGSAAGGQRPEKKLYNGITVF
jgi:hypothetical protein